MTAAWQSVAARSEGLGSDPVVTKPSGTADGDLLIAIGVCGAGQTISKPDASWNTHANSLGGQAPLFWKIASSEPANYTFVVSGSVSSIVQVVRISGAHATTPIDAASGAFATSGTLVPASINSGGANRLLFGLACKLTASANIGHPGSMTERYDTTVASQTVCYEGADETVGSGATGTRTWTPSAGTSPGVAYMLAIAPPVIPGDLAGTTPVVTAALVGAVTGLLAASSTVPTAVLVGSLDGFLTGQTPAATAALAGTLPGDMAGQTPAAAAALLGDLPGDLAGQTAVATASLVGVIVGDLDPSTPRVQADLAGVYTPPDFGSGALAAAIPAATVALAGDYADPPGVLIASTAPATGVLTGSLDGQLAGTAAKVTAALTGYVPSPGALTGVTPGPPAAVLVGSIVGTLSGATPAATASLRGRLNYAPAHHKATVREVPRTHAVTEVGRTHAVSEQSRKTTVMEGIA